MAASDPAQLFEKLAKATWDRIRYGEDLECTQSEETLTDFNLLELKRAQLWNVSVRKANKAEEGRTGIDWEWWIGSDRWGWWRYAVQAKKVNSGRIYGGLRQKTNGLFQIDLLETYARASSALPLYCFYVRVHAVVTTTSGNRVCIRTDRVMIRRFDAL